VLRILALDLDLELDFAGRGSNRAASCAFSGTPRPSRYIVPSSACASA
jgi:hypothetical protein